MNRTVSRRISCLFGGAFVALFALTQTTLAANAYYFGTWAGTSSSGTADGAGSVARFYNPAALAADAGGNLYVADTGNHTLRVVTPAGVVSTLAGTPGQAGRNDGPGTTALLNMPQAVVLHSDGNLYVGEATGISRVTRDGRVTNLLGTTVFPNGVIALASDSTGTLLAADQSHIVRVTLLGEAVTLYNVANIWSGPSSAATASIGALAHDTAGNIFVAINGVVPGSNGSSNQNQARVYRIAPGGSMAAIGDETNGLAGVGHIRGLTVDSQGAVYAAASSCAIFRISGGQLSVYAGMSGSVGARDGAAAQALFNNPLGLAFDGTGNLFVCEMNNTIRRITSAGVVSTVAGIPAEDSARHFDARGSAARFNGPAAIALAANGVVYVADRSNHVIRRIAADGTVTTLAGAPGQAGYVDGPAGEARFNLPSDLAVDAAGNVYVIESSGGVRKITPSGDVSTLTGGAAMGTAPAPDGQGSAAKFGVLTSIAVSPAGDIYVAEAPGYSATYGSVWARLRRITPTGVVTTISSLPVNPHTYFSSLAFDRDGVLYAADPIYGSIVKVPPQGTGERIRTDEFFPRRLAVDSGGNLIMTEDRAYGATRVARFTAGGQLEVIGGARYAFGHHDAVGTRARFYSLTGIAVDGQGAIYLTDDDDTVRKGVPASAPSILSQPAGQSVTSGAAVTFAVSAAAVPEPLYQWYFNGTAIVGATSSSYTIAAATSAHAGNYHVVVANELDSVASATAALTVTAAPSGGGSGSGTGVASGGGGAPSDFFLAACGMLALARWWQRRRASVCGE
ncbi:MAG: immunoglobulin domain-containing protein [Candidatus Didemnitutus sp.]|nr:immunoglobulin domain-containing protein [Candidatus Didemnitutus sp.]